MCCEVRYLITLYLNKDTFQSIATLTENAKQKLQIDYSHSTKERNRSPGDLTNLPAMTQEVRDESREKPESSEPRNNVL